MTVKDNRIPETLTAMEKAVRKALYEAAVMIQEDADKRCPVNDGNLRGSLTFAVEDFVSSVESPASPEDGIKGTGERGVAYVGTNVDYAAHVEYGTKPHVITVKNAKVLSDGKNIFGKKVNHPGTAPQPFLRPALDTREDEITRKIRETLRAAIE